MNSILIPETREWQSKRQQKKKKKKNRFESERATNRTRRHARATRYGVYRYLARHDRAVESLSLSLFSSLSVHWENHEGERYYASVAAGNVVFVRSFAIARMTNCTRVCNALQICIYIRDASRVQIDFVVPAREIPSTTVVTASGFRLSPRNALRIFILT